MTGGFSLAAQQVWHEDHNIHSFIEIDKFCQKVLKKHWPDVSIISDIKDYKHDGTTIDLLTGGVPCQPASCAGKQRGTKDDRWLWPETFGIIREVGPTWCILENVKGLLALEQGVVFELLLVELETLGYETETFIIPACAVNAPHRRDRVWIVANSRRAHGERSGIGEKPERQIFNQEDAIMSKRSISDDGKRNDSKLGKTEVCELQFSSNAQKTERKSSRRTRTGRERPANCDKLTSNTASIRLQNRRGMFSGLYRQEKGDIKSTITGNYSRQKTGAQLWQEPWLEVATRLCRVDDGLPRQVDRVNRLKALGNAIVPQVVIPIMQAIKEVMKNESMA